MAGTGRKGDSTPVKCFGLPWPSYHFRKFRCPQWAAASVAESILSQGDWEWLLGLPYYGRSNVAEQAMREMFQLATREAAHLWADL